MPFFSKEKLRSKLFRERESGTIRGNGSETFFFESKSQTERGLHFRIFFFKLTSILRPRPITIKRNVTQALLTMERKRRKSFKHSFSFEYIYLGNYQPFPPFVLSHLPRNDTWMRLICISLRGKMKRKRERN